MSALPILTITKNGETIRSQAVEKDLEVGRDDACVIRLDDRAVSRHHALIRHTSDGGVQIEKRSEFAPLSVNGAECTKAFLKEGDVIEIGPYLMKLSMQNSGIKKSESKNSEFKLDHTPEPTPLESFTQDIVASAPLSTPDSTVILSQTPGLATPIDPGMDLTTPLELDAAVETTPNAHDGGVFDSLEMGQPAEPIESSLPEVSELSLMNEAPEAGEDDATRIKKNSVNAQLILIGGTASIQTLDIGSSEVFIGRGKNCEIVVDDKKASRKNSVILKDVNRYVIRDLDSSNGTYVNGQSIKEKILESDDVVRVGDVEFKFVATNPAYKNVQESQLPFQSVGPISGDTLEVGQSSSLASPLAPDFNGVPDLGSGFQPSSDPIAGMDQASGQKQSLYVKYIRNFKDLKPVQKLMVVLVLAYAGMYFLEDETPAPTTKTAQFVKKSGEPNKVGLKTYESLTPEQRQFVDSQYQLGFEFYTKKDYNQALYEITKIYPILPDYEKAKELERYALEGKKKLAAIEEERAKKEEEARIMARIGEITAQVTKLMRAKKYDQAQEVFAEILEVEPDNQQVAEWQKEIDAYREEQQRLEQERLVQQEINKRGWDQYQEGFALQKQGQFHEAISAYRKVADIGVSDKSLLAKAKTMIAASQQAIQEKRDPILARAKELEDSGDLGGAYKEYEKATVIDPPHPAGYAGQDRIRGVLNERSKILYTEAVIAESYSDFNSAYRKFKEIQNLAPTGTLYHQRATRKLAGYYNFKPEEAVTAPAAPEGTDAP
jgi:pSer/pThr/pTyr-binding forkhead associated (FHA) protein